MIEPTALMRLAIDKAREGIAAGNTPFGCAIARGDELIAVAHNTVHAQVDITAHAEINAIRAGCLHVGQIFLEGAIVASTCEPCPMCMAALHWARVDTVHYGATVQDAVAAGFNELRMSAQDIVRAGGSSVKLKPGLLADECRELLGEWRKRPSARAY